MSAVAVSGRSLFEISNPIPMRNETPHRPNLGGTVWREVPPARPEPQRAATVECSEEDGERWDGMS